MNEPLTTYKKYSDPSHPNHLDWWASRRNRYCKILREGKKLLRLLPEEKDLVTQLTALIDRNTTEKEKEQSK